MSPTQIVCAQQSLESWQSLSLSPSPRSTAHCYLSYSWACFIKLGGVSLLQLLEACNQTVLYMFMGLIRNQPYLTVPPRYMVHGTWSRLDPTQSPGNFPLPGSPESLSLLVGYPIPTIASQEGKCIAHYLVIQVTMYIY